MVLTPPKEQAVTTRPLGVLLALAFGIFLTYATFVLLAFFGVRENTIVRVTTAFAAPLAGLLFAGWKKPQLFLGPICRVPDWLASNLTAKAQRALFLLGALATLPWIGLRVFGSAWRTSTIHGYVHDAYYPLLNTVLNVGAWYEPAWCDWLMLLAIAAFALAFLWRPVVSPLLRWVHGSKQ